MLRAELIKEFSELSQLFQNFKLRGIKLIAFFMRISSICATDIVTLTKRWFIWAIYFFPVVLPVCMLFSYWRLSFKQKTVISAVPFRTSVWKKFADFNFWVIWSAVFVNMLLQLDRWFICLFGDLFINQRSEIINYRT